jgi:hypothetical protein
MFARPSPWCHCAARRTRLALLLAAVLALSIGFAGPAAEAASEAFTIRDLAIDAEAKSATEARTTALAKGQREAYRVMLERFVMAGEAERLPPLEEADLVALIEGFEINDERVSPTRYRANLTVAFREETVKALLRGHGVRFIESAGRPVIVIPVLSAASGSMLWRDDNLWLRAWSLRDKPEGLVPIIVPLGDTADIAELDVEQAIGGSPAPLLAFAQRYGAAEALVLEARPGGDGLEIKARRVTAAGVTEFSERIAGAADGLYAAAADRVVELIERDWKEASSVRLGTPNSVRALAPLAGLGEWVSLRATLAALPEVQTVEVIALARSGADIVIHFFGDTADLVAALAAHDLALDPAGPNGGYVLVPARAVNRVVGSG